MRLAAGAGAYAWVRRERPDAAAGTGGRCGGPGRGGGVVTAAPGAAASATSTGFTHEVAAGAAWAVRLRRHRALRLTCLDGGANVSVLMYAAADPLERLDVPDTLKAQMSACVRAPMVLMSDMGRALASVTGSSLDWHDAVTGHSTDGQVAARFGPIGLCGRTATRGGAVPGRG
ncbi:DUF1989 domain-containing protein [Yinghuangia aomiensis]